MTDSWGDLFERTTEVATTEAEIVETLDRHRGQDDR
jgi:hypothetical protein